MNDKKPSWFHFHITGQLVVGMAQGIPRLSFLEVPDLFSLFDSQRNRFYHSSNPRGPRQNSSRTSKIGYLVFILRGPPFRPYFMKFSKPVFNQVNIVSQCSHLEVLLLNKFASWKKNVLCKTCLSGNRFICTIITNLTNVLTATNSKMLVTKMLSFWQSKVMLISRPTNKQNKHTDKTK